MNAETILQNQIRVALSEYGICIRNNVGTFMTEDGRKIVCGVKGMSDLMFLGRGKCVFLEVKTETGKPTQEQLNFISHMKHIGINAGIVRSVDDAIKLIGVGNNGQ